MFFNILLPDHSAGVFDPPQSSKPNNILNAFLRWIVSGLHHWDAKYFIHIAHHGYTYENTLAFFPLFPMLIRLVANTAFYPFQLYVSYDIVLCWSALMVNLAAFVASAVVFHHLSLTVLNEKLAYKAAQLYCINPASIFFTAYYSESLFALVSFAGMLFNERRRTSYAVVTFALSGIVRSNGVVNMGYVIYNLISKFVYIVYSYKCKVLTFKQSVHSILRQSFQTVLCCLAILIPFTLYQIYGYILYCTTNSKLSLEVKSDVIEYGNANDYKMAHTGRAEWCADTVPLPYSYVQKTHWNLGFLNYYQLKQIPNFMMATPVVILSLVSVWIYVCNVKYNTSLKQYVANLQQICMGERNCTEKILR